MDVPNGWFHALHSEDLVPGPSRSFETGQRSSILRSE